MNYLPSPLTHLFQLATSFEYQNPALNAKDCARHINEVDHPPETFLSNHTIAASAVPSLEDEYHYFITIEHQYRDRKRWYTSARLDGEIMRGANPDACRAIGMVRMSPALIRLVILFGLFGLAFTGLFLSMGTVNMLVWLFPALCFGVAGYHLWMGFVDQNSLLSAIEYLMTDARSFSANNKRKPVRNNQKVMKQAQVSLNSASK
jgi:hypothetical protein